MGPGKLGCVMATHPVCSAHGERELRIIAGDWRGRRLRFAAGPIRPTPDRVRETLFNWLQHGARGLRGLRCLDLYAGSGALGLEALSRGAAQAVFVECELAAVQTLRALLADWGAAGAEVRHTDAQRYLAGVPVAFDLVFLDPPFAADELGAAAVRLDAGWLAAGARVYMEHAARTPLPALPQRWRELRAGRAGEVGYHLFQIT